MMMKKHSLRQNMAEIRQVFMKEIRGVFNDNGVILIFIVAGLLYPILYNLIYYDENVCELPVAVVDDAKCDASCRFIHKIDATPEIDLRYECANMEEAKTLMRHRKINGIIYFPRDYGTKLAKLEQTKVMVFCDMSSFLYYRSILLGSNHAMLDELKHIELVRYNATGIEGEAAQQLVTPVRYDEINMFCPTGGYSSFLIPAILVMIVHQTLLLGVSVRYGTENEERKKRMEEGVFNTTVGRALAYFIIYAIVAAFDLVAVPRMFNLPHIGNPWELCQFIPPFLLATIFFSMTIGAFIRKRETGILTMISLSLIFLFISGVAWPTPNIPIVWRYLSYLIPSTHGMHGYIRINSMGASIRDIPFEYISLWAQAIIYFITACLSLKYANRRYNYTSVNKKVVSLPNPSEA